MTSPQMISRQSSLVLASKTVTLRFVYCSTKMTGNLLLQPFQKYTNNKYIALAHGPTTLLFGPFDPTQLNVARKSRYPRSNLTKATTTPSVGEGNIIEPPNTIRCLVTANSDTQSGWEDHRHYDRYHGPL